MSSSFPKPHLVNPLTAVMEARGLTQLDVAAIELVHLSGVEIGSETNINLPWVDSGQRIPYFDIDGHPLIDPKTGKHFCRYRLNFKRDWKFTTGFKPGKYTQAKPSSPHLAYVPRGVGIDWHRVAADPQEPIMFTEGEYKAIAACKMGIATVGLGGIWMFAQDSRKMPIPVDDVNWNNKQVVICFDAHETSTAEEPLRPNDELKAAKAFANKISIAGASPYLVFIAKTQTFLKQQPRVKMGIDDFRDAGGTLDELMATMEELTPEDRVLSEMIRDWCVYLGSKPFIMDRATGTYKHGAGDFINVVVSDRKVKKQVGDKITLVPAGRAFLDLPPAQRPTCRKIVFNPEFEFGLDQTRDHFNTWKGLLTTPGMKDPDALDRDVAIWRKYLMGVAGSEDNAAFLEHFMAHLVQRPWEKPNYAVVLGGTTEGTGKSLYGAIAGALVGANYRHSGPFDDFFGDYKGSNIDSKLVVQIEESEGLSRGQMARLKDFITNPRTNISIKYVPDYENDNLARVIVTSNALDPVKVDETGRRWFVARTRLTQEEVVSGWREWVGREVWGRFCLDNSEDENWPRRHLMYHLMNCVDLRDWDSTAAPPVTEDMEDMIEATRDAGELGMVEMYGMLNQCEEGFWVLPNNVSAVHARFWSKFRDFVKTRGGQALRTDTRAFGERSEAWVLAPRGKPLPVKKESKGAGKFRTVLDYSAWVTGTDKDTGRYAKGEEMELVVQLRARDALIEAFEAVAPIL